MIIGIIPLGARRIQRLELGAGDPLLTQRRLCATRAHVLSAPLRGGTSRGGRFTICIRAGGSRPVEVTVSIERPVRLLVRYKS